MHSGVLQYQSRAWASATLEAFSEYSGAMIGLSQECTHSVSAGQLIMGALCVFCLCHTLLCCNICHQSEIYLSHLKIKMVKKVQ